MAGHFAAVFIGFLVLAYLAESRPRTPRQVEGPLVDYVYEDDGYYEYNILDEVDRGSYTSYIINMTSQMWYDWNLSNRYIWFHYMSVHVPKDPTYPDAAYIYIGGGSNTNNPPTITDQNHQQAEDMAERWGFVTIVVEMIPNQPINFLNETGPTNEKIDRTEDGIIAWTWMRFMELQRYEEIYEPNLLLYFPMCKGAVKAMDTAADLVFETTGNQLARFEVAGESKRGWTAWLVGAIDDRVVSLIPVVMSCLNMNKNFHHYSQSFGGWPYYMFDYWSQGVMRSNDDPEMAELEKLVDPYSYIEQYKMPLLLISASSDEFFLLDDTWYFWDDLPGNNNYFWVMEDASHWMSRNKQYGDYWEVMGTFFASVLKEEDRPDFSWERYLTESGGGIDLTINSGNLKEITVFSAPTVVEDRRDWRLKVLNLLDGSELDTNITWTPSDPTDLGDGQYNIEFENPETGYLAFFYSMVFEGPEGEEFFFTSEVQVIPDGFPHEDCSGEECHGRLW